MDCIYKEIDSLLELEWDPEYEESIRNIKANLKGYSMFLTKSLKDDILKLLNLAKEIKTENQELNLAKKI